MNTTITYTGTLVKQREDQNSPQLFTFYAKTSEIMQWAGIKRTSEHERGTQRVLQPPRMKAVKTFLQSDPTNTLPGCIIVGFRGNSAFYTADANQADRNNCGDKLESGKITVNFDPNLLEHEKPALIVDGQHRLNGAAKFTDEDIPLLVVAMLDSDVIEEAFQFIVINQKSSKVKTTNIKSIISEIGDIEITLKERLLNAGIRYGVTTPTLGRLNSDPESPFYKIIDWEINDRDNDAHRIIATTAIEMSIKQLQHTFDDYLTERDTAEEVYTTIWKTLKSVYPELWKADSKFLSKVNMLALNSYISHSLFDPWVNNTVDPLENEELTEYVYNIFTRIPKDFWSLDWKITIQDNANVRDLITQDIGRILMNSKLGKNWSYKLKLIDQISLSE